MSDSVVETDTPAKQGAEDNSAQDLDSLLNEYEAGAAEPQKTTEVKANTDANTDVVNWARQEMQIREQERLNSAINDSVNKLKDGLDVKIPDRALKGILYEKADSDPRFRSAWADRQNNPKGFERVLKALQKEIKDDFGEQTDKTVTDDREALASAVRGASTSTTKSETGDFNKSITEASDSDFQKQLREFGL